MPTKVLMPALSPTMTEGTLAKWLVKEGDEVASGDPIAEIETDKATMEVEAVEEGTIGKILVDAGTDGVKVNEVIALLLEEGEDESALDDADTASPAPPPDEGDGEGEASKAQEKPKEAAPEKAPAASGDGGGKTAATSGSGASYADKGGEAGPAPRDGEGNRIFSSPLARRIAKLEGIDLGQVSGSGPHGRIVKADVEKAVQAGTGKAAPAAAEAPAAAPAAAQAVAQPAAGLTEEVLANLPEYEEVAASSMRKVVAKRLTESKQTVPHFYLTIDCELDALLALRKDLNGRAPEGEGAYKLSVNDFIIRACASALKKVPAANAMWAGDKMYRFKNADISVAVAIEGGLITPIIKAAETKGLVEISKEMRDLATRAREGKLLPEEYQGGTFSISNLGMYGIKQFEAVINPPQGCILAVGTGEERAVVKNGTITTATMMSVTLSVDHRVVDGAVGAEFLAAFKPLIEDPVTMLL